MKKESIPKINRRLFRLWSEAVKRRADYKCEYCGANDARLNAHHIISRAVKDSKLKFDLMNGIALCVLHHKFGNTSFHKNPVVTINWLIHHSPDQFNYLLKHHQDKINLQDREILRQIEKALK